MKTTMKTINQIFNLRLLAILCITLAVVSCSNDDDAAPDEENEIEVITNVSLVFTNTTDNTVVRASALDPDAEGIEPLGILNEITLSANTEYTLTYEILNALDPDDVENIVEEIEEEDDEHQIFYSFTGGAFSNPTGNGNIDTASDPVNYNDEDENGNPVGLSTTWTTADAAMGGAFRVRLQHQPDLKSATTGAEDGDTDFDLTFVLNIE